MDCFVIGDHDLVTGFRLVGVKGVEVSSLEEAKLALRKAVLNVDFAIVLISEEFSSKMRYELGQLREARIVPVVLEIPTSKGPVGEVPMGDLISRSLGVKL